MGVLFLFLWCVSSTVVSQETGFKENDICPFTLIVGQKGSNKPYSKINSSDLKGPCCVPVMRIKYHISPKSHYTVMNIPLHCQEPGGGSLWCLLYWWAIILPRGSLWSKSQEAQFPSLCCTKAPSSTTKVIPIGADPFHSTLRASSKTCLAPCRIRSWGVIVQKREVTSGMTCRCQRACSGIRAAAISIQHWLFGSPWATMSFCPWFCSIFLFCKMVIIFTSSPGKQGAPI